MFKMKLILVVFLMAVFVVGLIGCGDSKKEDTSSKGDDTKKAASTIPEGYVEHKAKRFSIAHPKGWMAKDTKVGVMVTSPSEGADDFRENVSVAIGYAGDKSLEDYYKEISSSFSNFKELDSKEVDVAGTKGKRVVCTYEVRKIKLKVLFYLAKKGKGGVAFFGTAKPDTYDKYEKDFDNIIKSFK